MKAQLQLDKWQEEVMNCKSKRILICKGRQIGGTTVFAAKAGERLANNERAEILVVSITEEQAYLVIMMVLTYLEKHYPKLISSKLQDTTKGKIILRNKSKIISRPVGQTGNSVRGFTKGVLWLNEGSRLPEFVFEAAKPMLLTTAGDIWMDSTPFGKQGYFYNCFVNKSNIWTVFYKTSEEVIKERPISESWTLEQRDGALQLLKDEKIEMSELQYGQEYLGLFLDDLRRFYDDAWIEKVCILKRPEVMPKKENYMGVDIARMGGDKTTYETLAVKDKKVRQIAHHQEDHKPTTHTEKRIIDLVQHQEVRRVGIDAGSGSLGVGVYDHLLENPITRRKVVAMNNRQIAMDREGKKLQRIMNEDFHDNLKSMGEHGEILLLDDDDIKNSFRSIQVEIIKNNDMITDIKIHGRDSHIVEGIKRAAWLAKKERNKNFNIYYI